MKVNKVICLKNILIVEDDQNIHEMLKKVLQKNHYNIKSAYSGTEALLVHGPDVDLIILDLMLPGKNGEDIIKELKQIKNTPVIVTSAISDIDKKLDLFKLDADDYVTKPFNNDELLARINVHISKKNPITFETIKSKDIELNKQTYTATCKNINLNLSKIEFAILKLLMQENGRVVTKSTLFDTVWNDKNSADDNTLNVHISKIRNKLKQISPNKEYIETIWSIGYKFKD